MARMKRLATSFLSLMKSRRELIKRCRRRVGAHVAARGLHEQMAGFVDDRQRGGGLGMQEAVDLAGEQRRHHVAAVDAKKRQPMAFELEFFFGQQIAAEEGEMNRRKRRDRDAQRLLEDFVDDFRLKLVAEHQAGVTGIGAAHHREWRRAAALDQSGIEPRHLRRAAHIEVEVAAPELLDALDGLAGLEAGFDNLEIVPLVGAGAAWRLRG